MDVGNLAGLIVLLLLAVFVLVALAKSVRIVPQARAGIVEAAGAVMRQDGASGGRGGGGGRRSGHGTIPGKEGEGRPAWPKVYRAV